MTSPATINHTSVTYPCVYGLNATYETARTTSYGLETAMTVGQFWNTESYYPYRSVLKFNTATLEAGENIAQVNLNLAVVTDASVTDFDVVILKYNWSASDPPAAGNQETIYDGVLGASADNNIWRNTSGMSADTYYLSGNLDTTWVNKSGITYYGLNSSRVIAATAPTGNEYVNIDKVTRPPQLIITYNFGGGSQAVSISPFNMFMQQWKWEGCLWRPKNKGLVTI
jgi:hypothetical protein